MTWRSGPIWHKHATIALLIALLFAAFLPPKVALSQVTPPASYTFEECDQVREASLRDELNRISQAVFTEGQGGLDVATIVDRNWEALNIDAAVDGAVAEATERVRSEESLWDRIISGWSPAKAEELTKKIATYAFDSQSFRLSFDELSIDISADIVTEIRLMTAQSASSALLCVQTFIGDTMSPTMAAVLEEDIQARLEEIEFTADEDRGLLEIVGANPNLTSGVAVIIGTQIARTLGKQLSQKIAGNVVGRMLGRLASGAVPLVGWVIGAGLIVWDLFNAQEGSLPQIQDALQAQEVKDEIRAQVAEKVGEELRRELPQQARSVSNDVYARWQEFRNKYARVLELAEASVRFRGILDTTPVSEVKKLADLIAVLETKLGTDRLENLLERGQFERILSLPQEILEMLELGVDPEVVIAWADLAGDLIAQVVSMELYRVASPTDFSDRADLERVLALKDAELIRSVMLLDRDERDAVLGLPTSHIEQVLEALSPEDLSLLAKVFLTNLEAQERNLLVDRVLRAPEVLSELRVELVQETLLESQDFEETLNYITQKMSEKPWVGQASDMLAVIGPVLSGELSWALFWHYDGTVLRNLLYILVALIVLATLRRKIMSGRQRKRVSAPVVLPEKQGGNEALPDVIRIERRSDEETGT